MASRPSRIGTWLASQKSDFTFVSLEDEHEPTKTKDPARVAVAILMQRAVTAAGLDIQAVGRDGVVVVVILPASGWIAVALEEWREQFRLGMRYLNGFQHRDWLDGDWFAWAPEGVQRAAVLDEAAEVFAKAVARGHHCVGLAADLGWLPPDIINGADFNLVLPLLTGADIATVAGEICKGPVSTIVTDEHAAALTPRLLRLAYRPDQDADSYLRKLQGLLERELAKGAPTASSKSASPRSAPTLNRLHGMCDAVAWGLAVHNDLRAYQERKLAWADVDRGCLLSGPPGTGKTLFARALAATCDVPLVSGSYGQWYGSGNSHQGDLLKAMRRTFKEARDCAPSILFIDEIDSFPNRATITHHYADWEIQVVNALLTEVDGVEGREGVILIAACNHPEKLDPALVRSGRLDKHIRVRLPDRAGLSNILREHLGNDLAGEDLGGVALAASGSSGADCERLVRGARRRARDAGRTMVLSDLLCEIDGGDDRSEAELWLTAVHESGHAVAGCELQPGMVRAVMLHASGDAGGGTMLAMSGTYLSSADVHRRLMFLLCGRAAEEVVIGEPSSGAGGSPGCDLAIATGIATSAAAAMGLDDTIGLVWSGVPDPSNLRQMLVDDPALTSRVRAILDTAYVDALALIRRRRAAVVALARALLARRVLDGKEATEVVAQHPAEVGS